MPLHHLERGLAGVGRLPGHHSKQQPAERIEIGARIDRLAAHLLGRHVIRRAHQRAIGGLHQRRGALGRVEDLGEAEIEHLDVLIAAGSAGDEDVLRLEIAVHDPDAVRFAEAGADLVGDEQRPARREAAFVFEQLREVAAGEVLHHQIDDTLPHAEVEDGDRVGIGELRDRHRLAAKALGKVRVTAQIGAQQLDRDALADADVLGEVDRAHAARSEQAFDAEAIGDDLADERVLLARSDPRAARAAEGMVERILGAAGRAVDAGLGRAHRGARGPATRAT